MSLDSADYSAICNRVLEIIEEENYYEEEYDEVTVNINVTSTSPYKKTLLGTYKLTKDKRQTD